MRIRVHVPLNFNDGSPIPADVAADWRYHFIEIFGGLTAYPAAGSWVGEGGRLYAEDIEVWEGYHLDPNDIQKALTMKARAVDLAVWICRAAKQEAVLMAVGDYAWLVEAPEGA